MPLLIDVNNVLHVTGVLPPHLAGPDLEGLSALIAMSRHRGEAVLLACDGAPRPTAVADPMHEVRWSGPGREADEVIAAEVDRSSAPRSLLVVSTDRAVRRHAARRRCRTMTAEDFLARLVEDHETAAPGRLGGAAGSSGPPPAAIRLPRDVLEEAARLQVDDDHPTSPPPPVTGRPRGPKPNFAPGGGITRPRPSPAPRPGRDPAESSPRPAERRPDRGGPAGRPRPQHRTADGPLLPADLLAEAAALEAELVERTETDRRERADAERAAREQAVAEAASDRLDGQPAHAEPADRADRPSPAGRGPGAAELPPELLAMLAEAAELAEAESARRRAADTASRHRRGEEHDHAPAPASDRPERDPATPPPSAAAAELDRDVALPGGLPLPEDVIAEAERMLRELDDDR